MIKYPAYDVNNEDCVHENKLFRASMLASAADDEVLQKKIIEECAANPLFFFNTLAWTYNPKKVGTILGEHLPFVTYPYQDETILDIVDAIESGMDVGVEKSREMGWSWVLVGFQLWGFLFKGWASLYGSYKENYVDENGNMDSHFERIRYMIERLPEWITPDDMISKYMGVTSREIGGGIAGDSGANFGTGGRRKFVAMDEFALWAEAKKAIRKTRDVAGTRLIGGCITENSLLFGENGMEKISVTPDGYSPTKEKFYGKDGFHDVIQRFGNGYSRTKKIKVTGGYGIEGTWNHKILTPSNEWKELQELKEGDEVVMQRNQNVFGKRNDFDDFHYEKNWRSGAWYLPRMKDLCYLVGLYIADGCHEHKRTVITNADKQIQEFLLSVGFTRENRKDDDIHFRLNSVLFSNFLEYLGFRHGAHSKHIPKKCLELRKEYLIQVLRGMFDGDGCWMEKRNRVTYTTVSEELANQVHVLLLNFGIISSKYSKTSKPSKKVKVPSTCFVIEIGGHNAKRFQERVGFNLERKKGMVTSKNEKKCHLIDEQLFIAKVREIKDSDAFCYDLVIPETKQYFANGFIVHNTPEGLLNEYGKMMNNHPDYATQKFLKVTWHWTLHPEKSKNARIHGTNTMLTSAEAYQAWKDGKPVTSDWYEIEKTRRSADDLAREVDIAYKSSVRGRVYPEFEKVVKIGSYRYNPKLPLYTSWDYGRDMVAILFIQWDYVNNVYYMIDCFQKKSIGQLIDFFGAFVLGMPVGNYVYTEEEQEQVASHFGWQYMQHFGDPYNANTKTIVTNRTVASALAEVGVNLTWITPRGKEQVADRIKLAHKELPRVCIDKDHCANFIAAMMGCRYPKQRESSEATSEQQKPVHDDTSHFRTAFEYFVDNMAFINPPLQASDRSANVLPDGSII